MKIKNLLIKLRTRSVRFKKLLVYILLFKLNPRRTTRRYVKGSESSEIRVNLRQRFGINAQSVRVNLSDYKNFLKLARYEERSFPPYYHHYLGKKSLEHYLSFRFLEFQPNDILVDIASESSPFPFIIRDLIGCNVYRQDLSYPAGISGDQIGGNAAELPFADESVSKLSLNCSLEHFEGDCDIRFMHEATRILRPGGILCIVPLYLSKIYINQISPTEDLRGLVLDKDAKIIYKPLWARFERYYDLQNFKARILDQIHGLTIKLYYIENPELIDETGAVRLMALIRKT